MTELAELHHVRVIQWLTHCSFKARARTWPCPSGSALRPSRLQVHLSPSWALAMVPHRPCRCSPPRSGAREATRLRLEVHQGKDPAAQRRASGPSGGTFSALATRCVEEHAKKKNKSWKQAEALVRPYVLPVWGERDASTITRADVRHGRKDRCPCPAQPSPRQRLPHLHVGLAPGTPDKQSLPWCGATRQNLSRASTERC